MTSEILLAAGLAAEKKSAEVTDWAARIGWLVGLALWRTASVPAAGSS